MFCRILSNNGKQQPLVRPLNSPNNLKTPLGNGCPLLRLLAEEEAKDQPRLKLDPITVAGLVEVPI